jgi:UDPglucose--hexose-1-phosphate uridylyltransferase
MPPTPHRRYNPLLEEWVLCSPHRLERPWQGDTQTPTIDVAPGYDPACYLCPGNLRANGERNPQYDTTFAFDNDFPALLTSTGPIGVAHRLLRAEPATGVCRVVCFSPRHDLTLARMPPARIRPVIDTWAREVEAIGSRPDISYVQVFENKGAVMGCSNPHPHCQVWATGHVPMGPARRTDTQRCYFQAHGEDLLGTYLRVEVERGERHVLANDHWVVLVPFWAVWPFETMVVPRRRVPDLPSLTPAERDALADVIARLNARYDNLFRTSFPYSMGWHARPTDGHEHPWWRLHAVYAPPLLRSASIRKYLVGYEMTAEPQRDLTAELAAERLRALPEQHYLEARAQR